MCKQVFYVKILLHVLQVTSFLTKICFKNAGNSGRKWTVCQCVIYNPVIKDVQGHRFEIYTLVSEINENVDLVLGIKNVFKLGVINSQDFCFKFMNRSLPIFPKEHVVLKPKGQKMIKMKAPFIDEISDLAIIEILD